MSKESREHLSSLMDGEVNRETGRFLVRRLGADKELRATWTRYHLIRDYLRHQEGQFAEDDLSSRVRAAICDEPPVSKPGHWSDSWLKPAAGVAVAASVAMIAVLAVSNGNQTGPGSFNQGDSQTAAVESFTSPNINAMPTISQPVNLSGRSSESNQKMNSYLLKHYQVTGSAGGKGFVSFVPIVVTQSSSKSTSEDQQVNKESESIKR
jgi:sigma-E factor negative regulatory protein RseA